MSIIICMVDGSIEIIWGWILKLTSYSFCGELPLEESISYILQDFFKSQSAGGWVRFAVDALDLFCVSQLRRGAMNGVPEVVLQHMLDNMFTIIMWLCVHIF